jgi:hypothetical protein
MGYMRNTYKVLSKILKGRDSLEDIGRNRKIILKMIYEVGLKE